MADILLPELGEGIESVEISDVIISEGDTIQKDDPMIVVESDKASMEIPTTLSGTVEKVHVKRGDSIAPGKTIITIQSIDKSMKYNGPSPKENDLEEIPKPDNIKDISNTEIDISEKISTATSSSLKGKGVFASPSVRRYARELGCNLTLVKGTGVKGRVSQEDVQEFIKINLSNPFSKAQNYKKIEPEQDLDFSKWGNVDIQPITKIKRITGERLQKAWHVIPHVTQFDKADITKLEQLRLALKKVTKNKKIKVSILPFIMKAVTTILKEMPVFNSSIDTKNEYLILKKYYHIGIAVDTEDGLIVPVIQNVDQKSIKKLAIELSDVSQKVRNKQIIPGALMGGCFTISSLGGIGGTYFTPIINPPQVAILGISRMKIEPVYIKNKFRKRMLLPFSLSYDHRVIDGADAVRFTNRLGSILSNIEELSINS